MLNSIDPLPDPTWSMWLLFWELSIYSFPLHPVSWASIYLSGFQSYVMTTLVLLKTFGKGFCWKSWKSHYINCYPVLWRNPIRLQSKMSKEKHTDCTIIFNFLSAITIQYFFFLLLSCPIQAYGFPSVVLCIFADFSCFKLAVTTT